MPDPFIGLLIPPHCNRSVTRLAFAAAVLFFVAIFAPTISAASAAETSAARPLRIVVGTSAGATYDAYARLIGRHISDYLTGHPTVVVENMAGAGGLTAANYLYNVAPQDGTTIGVFARGLPTLPLLDKAGVQFDPTKFNWLGSPTSEVSLVWAWYTTPFKTFEDTQQREMIIPATGPGADSIIFPYVMNAVLGTKFKVISGYPGAPELFLAVERGEADGVASTSWSNFASAKHDWVQQGKVRFLLQLGLKKDPEIGDVPLVLDKAKNDDDRKVLELIFSRNTLAYPVVAPPNVPAGRVTELQEALARTIADDSFRADAKNENLTLGFVSGEQMTTILQSIYSTSPAIIERARRAVSEGQR